jgi:hypothetical protein
MRFNSSTGLVLTLNGREVEQVKSFTYIGRIVTINCGAVGDVHIHIKKANRAFVLLYTVSRNKKTLDLKVSCLIQMLSQCYCMGVKHGK